MKDQLVHSALKLFLTCILSYDLLFRYLPDQACSFDGTHCNTGNRLCQMAASMNLLMLTVGVFPAGQEDPVPHPAG